MKRKLTMHFRDKCKYLGYDGPKAALLHCISLNLGVCQTATQLYSTDRTIHKYAALYKLSFIDGRTKDEGFNRL